MPEIPDQTQLIFTPTQISPPALQKHEIQTMEVKGELIVEQPLK